MQTQFESTMTDEEESPAYTPDSEKQTGFSSAEEDEDSKLPTLTKAFQERVRPFIDLIDHLRQYGLDKDVGLPAVVVIGDQSAGKSSTLEAISGVQLPRGSGIVTRCPLQLRLKSNGCHDYWRARISYHKKGEDFSRIIEKPAYVGEEVLEAQNALAGRRKGITNDLITLEVEAHDIPDLTLIDLPGITRVAVQDQPEDIGDQIKQLIMKYIKKQETIILAVVPANVDIATTEALKMAMEVDPQGERTLGVVTKPDLIDRGTEAELMAVVGNMRFRLKKGFTVVKCRGQEAINKEQTLADALRQEEAFFANHETLSNLDPMLCGIKNLSNKLTNELVNHIKATLPALKEDVKGRLHETQAELHDLGAGLPSEPGEQTIFLVQLLDDFVNGVSQVSRGEYESFPGRKRVRLYTQARKHYEKFAMDIWKEVPGGIGQDLEVKEQISSEEGSINTEGILDYGLEDVDESEDEERDISDDASVNFVEDQVTHFMPGEISNRYMIDRIREEIDNQRGRELPHVWKFSILEMFIKENLSSYHGPAFQCLAKINSSLEDVLGTLTTAKLERFPKLEMQIKTLVNELRAEAFTKSTEKIKETFAMEGLIYTQDHTYLEKLDDLQEDRKKREAQINAQRPSASGFNFGGLPTRAIAPIVERVVSTKEKFEEGKVAEAKVMYEAIRAYLEVATRRILDYVPMIITYQMLESLSREIRARVLSLAADRDILDLLQEDQVVAHHRLMLDRKITRLTSATWELAKF